MALRVLSVITMDLTSLPPSLSEIALLVPPLQPSSNVYYCLCNSRVLKPPKKTIILLTKDTNYAYQISDKVFIMHLTKLVESGDKTLLQNEELLKHCNLEVPKIIKFINE